MSFFSLNITPSFGALSKLCHTLRLCLIKISSPLQAENRKQLLKSRDKSWKLTKAKCCMSWERETLKQIHISTRTNTLIHTIQYRKRLWFQRWSSKVSRICLDGPRGEEEGMRGGGGGVRFSLTFSQWPPPLGVAERGGDEKKRGMKRGCKWETKQEMEEGGQGRWRDECRGERGREGRVEEETQRGRM